MKIKKAVIPAAGFGTRFLPVTKSMPKEMLPLLNIPAIHYVVEEAVLSGIDDVIIITGRGKGSVEDYFDDNPELNMRLKKEGKEKLLEKIEKISSLADVHYIRQKEPRGLPDAILKAEKHIGDDPFAVLLGDDIIKSEKPCTKQLIEIFEKYNSSVLATLEISIEEIYKYGSILGEKIDNKSDELFLLKDVVEKPRPEDAPSNIASIGRYIFTPEFFDCARKTKPSINNELQISDTIKLLLEKEKVYTYGFKGKRYDIGDKLGYIQAVIDFSIENPEIGDRVKDYINKIR